MGEDFLFASTVLLACPRMLSTSSRIYRYVIHSNTASTNRRSEYMKKCVEDQLCTNDELMETVNSISNDKNSVLYRHSVAFLRSQTPLLLSRSFSARLSVDEFRGLMLRCHGLGLLPMPFYAQMTRKLRIYSHVINFLDRHPRFFPMASFVYVKVFVPFILKHIDRNYLWIADWCTRNIRFQSTFSPKDQTFWGYLCLCQRKIVFLHDIYWNNILT